MANECDDWKPGDVLVAKFAYDGAGDLGTVSFEKGDRIILKGLKSRGWAIGW
jgi:hypothetical protein